MAVLVDFSFASESVPAGKSDLQPLNIGAIPKLEAASAVLRMNFLRFTNYSGNVSQSRLDSQDKLSRPVSRRSENLSPRRSELSFAQVKEKWNRLLPVLFVAVFALSRIPGLMPANFSAAYAFAFCAGVYFRGATAWWLPLGTMLVTDAALNIFYYHVKPFAFYLLLNYAIFAALIGLGKCFGRRASFFKLLLGGLLGAVVFYLVTNTLAWLQDPAYAKTIAGWIQALTTGRTDVQPTTWEMFRHTLTSGGLFTALFVAAEKLTAPAESPADKTAGARDGEGSDDGEAPEEAKA
jgi:hypothetical protein